MSDRTHQRDDCILLFGMPRSGTTWLGKLFDSHPHVLYRHEPDDSRRPQLPSGAVPEDAGRCNAQITDFVRSLPDMTDSRVAGKRPIFPKAYISPFRFRLMQAGTALARAGSHLYPQFPILFHANGNNDSERRVVWKSIQLLSRLGFILNSLDRAVAIHIVRHPCGYLASMRRGTDTGKFTRGGADRNVYGYVGRIVGTPLGDNLGFDGSYIRYLRSLTPEERIAWMWVVLNEKAVRECENNKRYMRVCYEDLCAEPQARVEQMFKFAGLDMNPQTRGFISASTGATHDDYYSVFKHPEVAAWRWRDELEPETVKRVMAIAAQSEIGRGYLETTGKACIRAWP